jgi:hypothetical protein
MTGLTLHPMKEIRIIIQGEHVKFATDLLDSIKATGYDFHNIRERTRLSYPHPCSMRWTVW